MQPSEEPNDDAVELLNVLCAAYPRASRGQVRGWLLGQDETSRVALDVARRRDALRARAATLDLSNLAD